VPTQKAEHAVSIRWNIFVHVQFSITWCFSHQFVRVTVGLPGWAISPSQGLYLHRTAQHSENKDINWCRKWDSNWRSGVRALSARSLNRAATGLAYGHARTHTHTQFALSKFVCWFDDTYPVRGPEAVMISRNSHESSCETQSGSPITRPSFEQSTCRKQV
jgi:hypothetical protein